MVTPAGVIGVSMANGLGLQTAVTALFGAKGFSAALTNRTHVGQGIPRSNHVLRALVHRRPNMLSRDHTPGLNGRRDRDELGF